VNGPEVGVALEVDRLDVHPVPRDLLVIGAFFQVEKIVLSFFSSICSSLETPSEYAKTYSYGDPAGYKFQVRPFFLPPFSC